MNLVFSILKHLLAPLLFISAGVFLSRYLTNIPENLVFLFAYVPYFFLVVSILLCIQFNQSRLLFALLNISLFYLVLHSVEFSLLRLYEFLILIPMAFNFAVLAWLPERSVLSVHSVVKLSVMLVQALVLWYLLSYQFYFTEQFIFNNYFFPALPAWINFPWLIACILLVACVSTLTHYLFFRGPVEAALFMLCLMLLVFASLGCEQNSVISLSLAAGAFSFLAVLFDSHQMAFRDELTGLRSRRALNQYLTGLGRKYTIAMMDIDHFKKFNDNHGHDIGDQMLKLVASKIAKVTGGGTPFRYGGEEFTVVFPRRQPDDVLEHLEQLREAIEGYPLVIRGKDRPEKAPKQKKKSAQKEKTLSCTISIGLANREDDLKTPEQVIKGADEALYRAKKKGRNCVSQ